MFSFADGRRCRTPRLRNHPHFCFDHAQKEARACAADTLGKDLAYFFSGNYLSACDLGTALGRLIPAVVRGDVKPRTARTVAYMAQTLLQSIHISQDEYINAFGTDVWRKSIRNFVKYNHYYRFPFTPSEAEGPAPKPEQPQPQPQSAQPPAIRAQLQYPFRHRPPHSPPNLQRIFIPPAPTLSGSAARNLLFRLRLPNDKPNPNPQNLPHHLTLPCLIPLPNSPSRSWPAITRPCLIACVLCILVRPASPLGNNPRNPSPDSEANPSNPNPFYFSPQCRTARQQDSTRPPNASRSVSHSSDATHWPRARSNH
jgi:hypothetical protein